MKLSATVPIQEVLEKLDGLGATEVVHLLELEEEDVDTLGLKKLEKRRWNKELVKLKESFSKENGQNAQHQGNLCVCVIIINNNKAFSFSFFFLFKLNVNSSSLYTPIQ